MLLYALFRWLLNALILLAITFVVPGFEIKSFYTALITVIVLGLVNAIIRPILLLLTLPVNILTLGLFTLVINGFLFWFVSTFVKGLEITGFWPAFLAALIYSAFAVLIHYLIKEQPEEEIK